MDLGQHFLAGGIFPGTGHFSGSLCILGSIFCQGAFFRELAIFPAPYVSWAAFSARGHFSGNWPFFRLLMYLDQHFLPRGIFPGTSHFSGSFCIFFSIFFHGSFFTAPAIFLFSFISWATFYICALFLRNSLSFRLLMYLGQHFLPGVFFPATGHFSGSLCILGSIFCQGAFFRELAIFPAPYVSWAAFSVRRYCSRN